MIYHNRATESKPQKEEREENLVMIQQFAITVIIHFWMCFWTSFYVHQTKGRYDGGIAKIHSFCYSRSITDTPILSREIYRYAGMLFEREIEKHVGALKFIAGIPVLKTVSNCAGVPMPQLIHVRQYGGEN